MVCLPLCRHLFSSEMQSSPLHFIVKRTSRGSVSTKQYDLFSMTCLDMAFVPTEGCFVPAADGWQLPHIMTSKQQKPAQQYSHLIKLMNTKLKD